MAILKVARLGHPVLRKVAAPVPLGEIPSAETQRLIDDMVETMREYNGAGLAGNQVHVLKQICVIEVHGNPRYPEAPGIPLTVLINPVLTPLTDETLDLFAVAGPFEEIGDRIRERYRGLYDRTQLYPSFQPSLDDPRWPKVLAAFERA